MEDEINKILNKETRFLNSMYINDKLKLIEKIRSHPDKEKISNILFDVKQYSFVFEIIYDDPVFINKVIFLLDNYSYLVLDDNKFLPFISSSDMALVYVLNNLPKFLTTNEEEKVSSLVDYFISNNYDLSILLDNPNSYYRSLFILDVINNHPLLFDIKYLKNRDNLETLSPSDLSKIINAILKTYGNISLFYELKDYLLSNYKTNDLASELLENNDENGLKEFKKDANRLFLSSNDYQIQIMKKYADSVTKDIMDNYLKSFAVFLKDDDHGNDFPFLNAVYHGLSHEIKRCVDAYLAISTDKTCKKIGSGTTSDVYKIGDYVIKMVQTKWSYESIICPNLYLIAKDYENILIRNDKGIVVAGLEVQKYLHKKGSRRNNQLFVDFLDSLEKEGYYLNDTLVKGTFGDNAYFLGSYLDADTKSPESLPDWFKKDPLVLVDRDRVYELSNKHPKERSEFF